MLIKAIDLIRVHERTGKLVEVVFFLIRINVFILEKQKGSNFYVNQYFELTQNDL